MPTNKFSLLGTCFGAMASLVFLMVLGVSAQTTAFTYQGKLNDSGVPASGSFQMQFKLFDASSAGGQIGSTIADVPVTATQGVFSVMLDFGSNALSGANRWLEIAVRHNSAESYTTLSPREQIASSPYSVRTLSAAMADDSQKLGGVAASEYVTNSTGAANFIKNQTTQQPASNFNISGDGSAGRMFVGAPTALPGSAKLIVNTGGFGITHTDGTVGIQTNISSGIGSIGTTSFHPFGFFAGGIVTPRMTIDTGGNVGIGTTSPANTLDVYGFFRAKHPAGGNVVSETDGGTNAWAKFWAKTPAQQWSIGSSNNFNGNQLYFSNENPGGGIRMAIMPNGNVGIGTVGPAAKLHVAGTGIVRASVDSDTNAGLSLSLAGQSKWSVATATGGNFLIYNDATNQNAVVINGSNNIMQDIGSYGLPKAMIFVQANGTIGRCYNGVTGATTNNCGFSVSTNIISNYYVINFGFDVSTRFVSVTTYGFNDDSSISARLNRQTGDTTVLRVNTFFTYEASGFRNVVSDFFIFVY